VKDAYKVLKRPALGNSDHNMLYCLPTYVQKLKSQECRKIEVRKWTDDCIDSLKACFDCTDWNVICDERCLLDENVDVFSSYVNFCTDLVVPKRSINVFPNNKPWVTKDVKEVINKKKRALSGDRTCLRLVQKELNCKIRDAKIAYKNKVEGLFKSRQSKDAWKGLKYLSGCTTKNCMIEPENVTSFVEELNVFYTRFDEADFECECNDILNVVNRNLGDEIVITDVDVLAALNTAKPGKACGPDKVCAKVVKSCRHELVAPVGRIFQKSLDLCVVPRDWKTSEIVPVPKVKLPRVKNDLRSVALTSGLMKCFKSFVKKTLCKEESHVCHKFQFAYEPGHSVDDAILTLLDIICSHLNKATTYSRAFLTRAVNKTLK
jgi:hypothetical protein